MPASTVDPVNAALRSALLKRYSDGNGISVQLSASSRRIFFTDIEFESAESYQDSVLNELKSKYTVLQSNKTPLVRKPETSTDESLAVPKHVLYPLEAVQLGWNSMDWNVGAGMINLGNTCYLNSTLQALFHVPALVNWLLSDKQHMNSCEDSGGGQVGCIICAVTKTLHQSQQRNLNPFPPKLLYAKLRLVCRHIVQGRQEDAHEFLRYLVDAMERSYLQRFRHASTLDSRSKETTPLNQIFGGYLRSTVRCLECGHVSTTFQHFQDLLLDIRKVNTLDDALQNYFSREKLDDNAYHCENCKRKVAATKQFFLERSPMVLCIQLKRFSVSNNKITKHVSFRQRLELTRFSKRKLNVPLLYRLVALVTHMGPTVSCGHYTAVAQAATGGFYQFDDSTVRHIPQQAVFNTNAYIMLYELETPDTNSRSLVPCKPINSTETTVNDSSVANTSFTPMHLNNSYVSNTHTSTSQNGNWQHSNNGTSSKHSDSTSDSNDSEPESVVPQSNQWKSNSQAEIKFNAQHTNSLSEKKNSFNSENKKESESSNNYQSSYNSSKNYFSSGLQVNSQSNHKNSQNRNNTSSFNSQKSNEESNSKCESSTSQAEDNKSKHDTGKREAETSRGQNGVKKVNSVTKLVPYEVDDSSSSAEEFPAPNKNADQEKSNSLQIVTKATVGTWKVSPTKDSFKGPSLEGQAGWNRRQEAVSELLHLSHDGYAAPVSTWNGNRAQLNREIGNERREERKRAMTDNNIDKGRIKHSKPNPSHMLSKSNPGYNPFQEYNNSRKWQNDSHYHKPYYNGIRHRHMKWVNYHNRHRDKFRH